MMVDSDAIRSKRARLHRQGDHSMCRHATPGDTGDHVSVTQASNADPIIGVGEKGPERVDVSVTTQYNTPDSSVTPPPDMPLGSALEACQRFLEQVTPTMPDDDPRLALAAVAAKLARSFDTRPSAALGRELRETLTLIGAHPDEPADQVDELQARRAARRVDDIIRAAFEASS